MRAIANVVLVLAICGAVASWIVAVTSGFRTLQALPGAENRSLRWLAIVAWPFAVGRLHGAPARHAATANKAMVAFFACLMIAIAATSVTTNLSRYSR
jgi:hypothetical protein